MGLTTSESHSTIDLVTGAGAGSSVFTAANGDQVFSEWTSQPLSATVRIYDITVVGGTGRFEGATGAYSGRTTTVSLTATGGIQEGTWRGTISY